MNFNMSFINIINESFDKQNKSILAGSKSKKLKEATFSDSFNGHSDELDRFYDYMFEAAKDLGFQDFDAFDDGWTVTLTYIDSVGNKQQAEFDFDDELSFESKEDAIDCLVSLDWKVVDDEDEDLDEDLDTQSKNNLDFNEDDSSDSLKAKIEKLKNLDRIPDFFFGDSSIRSIVIPSNIKSIGDYAFVGCRDLKTITIPDSVTSIGQGAFQDSKGLTNITIPSSVTDIGSHAFAGCSGLTSIAIPDNVTWIEGGTFNGCSGLKSIRIPDMAEVIGGIVFAGCRDLTSVTIPSSVSIISDRVFAYCEKLKEITYKGTKADWNKIKKQPAWNYYSSIETIHCTDGDIEIENKW